MSYDFNANDIFEMAERIEENGANFYRQVATSVAGKKNKDFLLKLAYMEDKHKQTFNEMKTGLSKSEIVDTIFDPEDEALSYLKALADIRVFFKKKIDTSSLESVLKSAILLEKDSIIFYLGMKNLVPETMGKTKIDEIISEEMTHVKLLALHLKSLRT